MDLLPRAHLDGDLYAQYELVEVEQEIARARDLARALEWLERECFFAGDGEDFAAEVSDTIDELPPSGIRDACRKRLEVWRARGETNEQLAEIHMGLDLAVMDDDRPAFRRLDRSREDLLEEVQRDVDGLTGEGPWLDEVHQRLAEAQREVSRMGQATRYKGDTAGHRARHRRASRPAPVRHRGSRRSATRGSPSSDDPDPPPRPVTAAPAAFERGGGR